MIPLSSENDYLVGTNKIPAKPWEPEPGELVAVKDREDPYWKSMIFVKKSEEGLFLCAYYDTIDEDDLCPWEECEPLHKHFNVPKCPEDV